MSTEAIQPQQHCRRRGFTLVELLVVIVILGLLTSISLPIMSAASDSRRMREGARLLSSTFAAAQAKAIATGRSTGVIIERRRNNLNVSMEVYLAEVPPPYIGDALNSTASLQGNKLSFPSGDVGWKTVRPGDLVRLNYRGAYFTISATGNPYISSPMVTLVPTDPTRANDPTVFPQNTQSIAFQVFRQPIRTADAPAVITDGACIDLNYSGIDQYGTGSSFATASATDLGPVVVTFGPSGGLDRVYANSNVLPLPLTGVYLLVGKVEQTPIPIGSTGNFVQPQKPNYLDGDSRWVFISRQSGLTTTTENAYVQPTGPAPNATDVNNARRFATSVQNSSGI
jgi:prepilin-type N-terminal cleavage/methylation domain-containing protein